MGSYITSPLTLKRKPKFAPLGLSAISTGLQMGQQLGNMMPDNGVGNAIQGLVDPMTNIGNAMSYMGDGKIGKGLLSLIPGVGNIIAGKDNRAEEAELKAIAEKKATDAYFAGRKSGDSTVLNAINNRMAAFGKTIKSKTSFFPMGGSTSNQLSTPNAVDINANAEMITNPDGSTSGTHQSGNNIPLVDAEGNPEVIAEPGEVKVTSPDGRVDILSKQLGYAQKYEEATANINRLTGAINKSTNLFERNAMSRELVAAKKKQEDIVKEQRVINEVLGNVEDPNAQPEVPIGAPVAPNGYTFNKYYTNRLQTPASLQTPGFSPYIGNVVNPITGQTTPNQSFSNNNNFMPTGVEHAQSFSDLTLDASSPLYKGTPTDSPNLSLGSKLDGFLNSDGVNFASNILSMGAPIVANILNRKTMRKAAKDIANQTINPNKINTYTPTLNIDADVAAINSQHADNIKLTDMTSSPAMKNYLANVSGGNRIQQLNTPFQQKARFDANMKMNNVQDANNITNMNIDKENQLSGFKLDSRVGLELSKINQLNTTLDSMYKVINNSDMQEADKLRVQLLIKQLDNGNGVINRNVQQELTTLLSKLGVNGKA